VGDKDPNLVMIVFLKGNLVMIVVITMKNGFIRSNNNVTMRWCHNKEREKKCREKNREEG